MRRGKEIPSDRYVDVDYHQFTQPPMVRWAMRVAGVLTWPLVVPFALLSKLSDFVFLLCSQTLSLVPYMLGELMRYEFYRWTLRKMGENVLVGFGTVFLYRDIEIGDHVLMGMYNTVHYCNIGSYVLIADGCRLLSGSKYHNFERKDVPMALQGGQLRRIVIEDDVWIGANVVVMNNIGRGSIVGSASVVTSPVEPYCLVAGNPAREIRRR